MRPTQGGCVTAQKGRGVWGGGAHLFPVGGLKVPVRETLHLNFLARLWFLRTKRLVALSLGWINVMILQFEPMAVGRL